MYKCKHCKKEFEKPEPTRGYTSWCTQTCYAKYKWAHPEKYKRYSQVGYKRIREKKFNKCCLCDFKGPVDYAHIKARKDGGPESNENLAPLCPNHHRLFDRNLLPKSKVEQIKTLAELGA